MSRGFKFRFWDTIGKAFITDLGGPHCVTREGQYYHAGLDSVYSDVIIQQYTGFFDKNNKEICEGDIVKSSAEQMMANNSPVIYTMDSIAVVEYTPVQFSLMLVRGNTMHWSGLEILGNIFENPELL